MLSPEKVLIGVGGFAFTLDIKVMLRNATLLLSGFSQRRSVNNYACSVFTFSSGVTAGAPDAPGLSLTIHYWTARCGPQGTQGTKGLKSVPLSH